MSDFELKISSNLKVSHEPFFVLDDPDVFIFALRQDGTETTEEHDVFCSELGSQIEALKGMESPFMKQLYWQLVAMESMTCEKKKEHDRVKMKIMSRREECEIFKSMPNMDAGFVKEFPPEVEALQSRAVPMPIIEIPGPNPDPCFDPCSPECLGRTEPQNESPWKFRGRYYFDVERF